MACRMSILCCNSASSLRNAFLQVSRFWGFIGFGAGAGASRGVQGMEAGSGVRHVVSAQCEGQLQGAGVACAWKVGVLIKKCALAQKGLSPHLRRLWCRNAEAKRPMLLLAKRRLMTTAVATNSPRPSQLFALGCTVQHNTQHTTAAGHGQNSRCRLRLFRHHTTCADARQGTKALARLDAATAGSHGWSLTGMGGIDLTILYRTQPAPPMAAALPNCRAQHTTARRRRAHPQAALGWPCAQSRCAGQCMSQTCADVRQASRCCVEVQVCCCLKASACCVLLTSSATKSGV